MRARNLKPGFFKNPELADAGPVAQLLFAGLWLMADKEGRLKDQPRVIKAELFPYYDVDVNGELTVIERLGHIHRYVTDGIAVIEVCNFKKHQSPHHTERASELPPCKCEKTCIPSVHEINGEVTVNLPLDDGGNPSDSLIPSSLIPDSGSLIPDSHPLDGYEGKKPRAKRSAATRIPDGFELTDLRRAYAESKGVDPEPTFEAFCAYWRNRPKDAEKLNWDLTWHSWVLKDAKDTKQRNAPKPTRYDQIQAMRNGR